MNRSCRAVRGGSGAVLALAIAFGVAALRWSIHSTGEREFTGRDGRRHDAGAIRRGTALVWVLGLAAIVAWRRTR